MSIYQLPDLRPFRMIQYRQRLAGGAVVTDNGVLESDNWDGTTVEAADATEGWRIQGNGAASFKVIVLTGYLPDDSDGTLQAGATLTIAGDMESDNYDGTDVATGDATQGWRVEGTGAAEYQDVRLRGEMLLVGGRLSSTDGLELPEMGNATPFVRGTTVGEPAAVSWLVGTTPTGQIWTKDETTTGSTLHLYAADTLELSAGSGVIELGSDVELGNLRQLTVAGTSILGAWIAYSPVDTNLTLGNGVKQAAYMKIGKTVFVRYTFTLGTTSAVGTAAAIGLPFPAKNLASAGYQILSAVFEEGGVGTQLGAARIADNASVAVLIHDEGTSGGALTATAPFTWGSTDTIAVTGCYEID